MSDMKPHAKSRNDKPKAHIESNFDKGVMSKASHDKITQGSVRRITQNAFARLMDDFQPRQAIKAIMTAGPTANAPSKTEKAKAETSPAKTLSLAAKPKKKRAEPKAAKTAAIIAMPQASKSAGRPFGGPAGLRLCGAFSGAGVSGSVSIGTDMTGRREGRKLNPLIKTALSINDFLWPKGACP